MPLPKTHTTSKTLPTRRNTHPQTRAFALALVVVLGLVVIGVSITSRAPQLGTVAAGRLITLANEYRSVDGTPALVENTLLKSAAEAKAHDMAARGYFSHRTPECNDPWVFLDRAGYVYTVAGENLAVNFTESNTVTDAWVRSPTHRANITNPEFTNIGVGTAQGVYKGREAMYVVQFFARPAAPR